MVGRYGEGENEEDGGGEDEGEEQAKREACEEEESSLDLRNYLRDDILETVDECLAAFDKDLAPAGWAAADPLHRCVVCTLPHGICEHTRQWFDTRDRHPILDPLPKDNVDLTMDDIADVLTPAASAVPGITTPPKSAPSLANLRWEYLRALPADEVSGKRVDLSSPSPRAGHTMVLLDGVKSYREDTRLLVVFGGVSTGRDGPQRSKLGAGAEAESSDRTGAGVATARTSIPQQALSYHDDIRVFRMGHRTWHCPDATGDLPDGRYGHVSLALGDEEMWMFGGRLKGGRQAGDTYLLNVQSMQWDKTNTGGDGEPNPAPRTWSAAVKVREHVLLFGGADLRSGRILNDVWMWNIQTRRWGEQIVVGTPPLARYGHVLLACPDGQVLVLGGCCVCSSEEEGLPSDHDRLQLRVRVAADNVNRAYRLEEAEAAVGAFDNYLDLGGSVSGLGRLCSSNDSSFHCSCSKEYCSTREPWKRLSRRQAQLAAAVAARERDTAFREEKLREVLHEQAAMTYWARSHARHPLKYLDVVFLDTENMIWGAINPAVGRGDATQPVARMHFSAVALGHKVVLWGGCLPTSKLVEMVDGDIHVFDLVHRRWSRHVGERHPEGIKPRLDAAVGQLRRAERTLFEATQRAMTLGAPGGRTMQVVQAEAVIAVNRWRVQRVEDDMRCAKPSPWPRAAHAGCAVGQRVMYFGGWGAKEYGGEIIVLDVEHASEKEKRLEDEFHLRLERERQEREAAESETLRRAAAQEKMLKDLELARETAEISAMTAEDARSAIPELTIAPTPKLRCANSTTLWLEWDRPAVDSIGNCPDDDVTYFLYMRGGFREWGVGDDVTVEYLSNAQLRAAESASTIGTMDTDLWVGGASSLHQGGVGSSGLVSPGDVQKICGDESQGDVSTMLDNSNAVGETIFTQRVDNRRFLPAVITDSSAGGGLFDIRWADGEHERGVRRYRIHRPASPSPPWAAIYEGQDRQYAVVGMIPDYVVQQERAFPYEIAAEFSLQTKGAEVPREKLSRHSPVVSFQTRFEGQGPLEDGTGSWHGGASASVKARLVTAKALDDSISASRETAESSLSRARLHGHFVSTGRGGLYL